MRKKKKKKGGRGGGSGGEEGENGRGRGSTPNRSAKELAGEGQVTHAALSMSDSVEVATAR